MRCNASGNREGIEHMLDKDSDQSDSSTDDVKSGRGGGDRKGSQKRRGAKTATVAFNAPGPESNQPESPANESSSAGTLGVPLFQAPEIPDRPQSNRRDTSDSKGQSQSKSSESRVTDGDSEASDRKKGEGKSGGKGKSGKGKSGEGKSGGKGKSGKGKSGKNKSNGRADSDESGQDDSKSDSESDLEAGDDSTESGTKRRRRRRRRNDGESDNTKDEVTAVKGSTRMEAKKQRRREGRESGRRRTAIVSEAEFLARRESVKRTMVVRQRGSLTQIGVLEDDILVEHYVNQATATSLVGNVYLGKVQNVLPSMEAAFVDIGRGRNAVLYAGEVNWDAAGLEGQPKRIENALSSGDKVLVQVTKDPIGHKGARLTSQVSLPGRFLVYVPDGSMTGISRKLPDKERSRLRGILRRVLPEGAGIIVRTAAEGASEEDLTRDVEQLTATWERIQQKSGKAKAPSLLHSEPDLALRIVRDIFNADFESLIVSGDDVGAQLEEYLTDNAPNLAERLNRWSKAEDVFTEFRVDEQLAKALDRKVYLPSGGSLVIDRTEAMTVIDVNTGRFTGQGGNLEETVTRNNLEAAEEVVRQIRLRDTGGIIVIDFIDMVLESNRDLVLRRLIESLGRDRTKHQVAEVTSLGLVQMTRKRIGQGLLETFGETCDCCGGRGMRVHSDPIDRGKDRSRRPVRPPGSHDPVEAARSNPEKPEDEADESDAGPTDTEVDSELPVSDDAAELVDSLSDEKEDDSDTATLTEDVDDLDLDEDRE